MAGGGLRGFATMVVATNLLVACGSGAEEETTAVTDATPVETTVATSASARPTAGTEPPTSADAAAAGPTSTTAPPTNTTRRDSGPVVLESTRYPYALSVPAEEIFRPMVPATSAWDGTQRVIRGTSFLDVFTFTDGGMHVLGVEWLDDLGSLAQMFVDHGARHNGCSQATNQREVTVGGAPALVFTVDSCGFGGDRLAFARLVALHDQFGLIAFTETLAGREAVDMDRLVSYFSALEWRTG